MMSNTLTSASELDKLAIYISYIRFHFDLNPSEQQNKQGS